MSAVPTLRRPAPRRLWKRIVLLFLGLLLLVQAAGFLVIRQSIELNARANLERELEVGERIWRKLLAQKAQALAQGTAVLAADYGFRSVLAGDRATIESALENHAGRIGATASAWVATEGGVRAVHADDDGVRAALPAMADALVAERTAEWAGRDGTDEVAIVKGQPLQLLAVPVRAPLLLGHVVLGFPIDQALLDDLRQLSGLHAVLFTPGDQGRPRIVARTFDGAADALPGLPGDVFKIEDESMALRRVSVAAVRGDAQLVLLQSIDAAVAPYRELQLLLAAITLLGIAVVGAGGRVTARHVTRPLSALVDAAERMGRGDFSQALTVPTDRDEVGELATAFEQMRGRIAEHAQEVHKLAYWDRLTGLPNRAMLRERLDEAIKAAESSGAVLSVVMLNIERFKHVNEVLGYALGDRLLQGVARRLDDLAATQGATLGRVMGDKFVLLLPGRDAAQAFVTAQQIGRSLDTPFLLDDQTVDVSPRIGVASWPVDADDPDGLLNRAEVAMDCAKRRTAVVVAYDPSIDSASAQTLSLLSDLRRALERDELRLFLQPKIALDGRRVVGAEALVRWQHPTRGMVPPMAFIPFAEQTGFVRQLTMWVFEQSVRAWGPLQACGVHRVAVNLSTRDLMDHDLPAKLTAVLRRHGAPASGFCLEITEGTIMDEPERAEATLRVLSNAGFKLSIDDFGTGYSSLAYLQRLPVDELKIDRSFVMAMARGGEGAKIVRFTIDLAHTLGLSVVAEGVETAQSLDALGAMGCDEAQGYHMGKPIPADEMAAFARRWAAAREAQTAESDG